MSELPDWSPPQPDAKVADGTVEDPARREALRKIGVHAAFTAPAMLAMLSSEPAVATSHGGGGPITAPL